MKRDTDLSVTERGYNYSSTSMMESEEEEVKIGIRNEKVK